MIVFFFFNLQKSYPRYKWILISRQCSHVQGANEIDYPGWHLGKLKPWTMQRPFFMAMPTKKAKAVTCPLGNWLRIAFIHCHQLSKGLCQKKITESFTLTGSEVHGYRVWLMKDDPFCSSFVPESIGCYLNHNWW